MLIEDLSDSQYGILERSITRRLVREFRAVLTPVEFTMLMFVAERTIFFRKSYDRVSYDQFQHGIWSAKGMITAGLRSSKATFYRTRKDLRDKGMLYFEEGNVIKSPMYAINIHWTLHDYLLRNPSTLFANRDQVPGVDRIEGWEIYALVSNMDLMSLIFGPDESQIGTEHIENNTQEDTYTGCAGTLTRTPAQGLEENVMSADAVSKLRGVLASTTENTRQRNEDRKKKLNATALEKIFADAFEKAHPTEKWFPWRVWEQSSFKKAVHKATVLSEAREFVEWCVANFANVIQQHLRYMKSPPRLPEPGFIVTNIAKFWLAFEDSRDPNRALRARMASDEAEGFKPKPKPQKRADVAKLEAENAALKEKLRDADQKETARQATATREAKALIKRRPRGADPEFGEWDQ